MVLMDCTVSTKLYVPYTPLQHPLNCWYDLKTVSNPQHSTHI